jgi:hypothetical protein
MTYRSKQIGGNHYQLAIEPWDYVVANNLGYLEGNVVKYISRWKTKGGVQDLEKAQHYIEKLIEVENDRLRSAHAQDCGTAEGNTVFIVKEPQTGSAKAMSGAEYRRSEIDRCRIRYEGYGKPVSLGDII